MAYAEEREQFGRPIASFPIGQSVLANSLSNVTASIAMCRQVSALPDQGVHQEHQAAMAKAFGTASWPNPPGRPANHEEREWCDREFCTGKRNG